MNGGRGLNNGPFSYIIIILFTEYPPRTKGAPITRSRPNSSHGSETGTSIFKQSSVPHKRNDAPRFNPHRVFGVFAVSSQFASSEYGKNCEKLRSSSRRFGNRRSRSPPTFLSNFYAEFPAETRNLDPEIDIGRAKKSPRRRRANTTGPTRHIDRSGRRTRSRRLDLLLYRMYLYFHFRGKRIRPRPLKLRLLQLSGGIFPDVL